MNIKFVDEAGFEFLDVISYYEDQQAGLGRRFKTEVERTLLWLVEPRSLPTQTERLPKTEPQDISLLHCLHRSRVNVVDPCCCSLPP